MYLPLVWLQKLAPIGGQILARQCSPSCIAGTISAVAVVFDASPAVPAFASELALELSKVRSSPPPW